MLKKWLQLFFSDSCRLTLRCWKTDWFKGGSYALNHLDKKLEAYVDYDHGFYVELGANDGITQSNSLYFERKRGWRGVLIEPSPHNFLRCFKLRSPRNFVHCNACVGFDYKEKFVEITYANLMSVSRNLDIDLENVETHLSNAAKHLSKDECSFTFGAIAKTLTQILDESNAPKTIDFLSLDVEGAELEVLKGLDFETYHFKFLLIESRGIDRLQSFLEPKGFKIVDKLSQHDYLFGR